MGNGTFTLRPLEEMDIRMSAEGDAEFLLGDVLI
jgi:hypothetical protein